MNKKLIKYYNYILVYERKKKCLRWKWNYCKFGYELLVVMYTFYSHTIVTLLQKKKKQQQWCNLTYLSKYIKFYA